ncbi:rRNA maturation RNase YbeY [Winogradskyella sp. A2]|uniref:rRNA maturation RNase YbeY n=1 Tax=Winogradskyella sp. A2 TaxID=3366944 RepID=UPI00398C4908
MVNFNFETTFKLDNEESLRNWILNVIIEEQYSAGDINYIFCSDQYLLDINIEFLNHDTYTDIISFDYRVGNKLHGDIFISIDRVSENAQKFNVDFDTELLRVIIHGILHFCGYKDKSKSDEKIMRSKEDYYIKQY